MKFRILAPWVVFLLVFSSGCLQRLEEPTTTVRTTAVFNCKEEKSPFARDFCYIAEAKVKKDIVLCEKVEDQNFRFQCYLELAKAKKDSSLCEKVEDVDYRYFCEAYSKRDPSSCEKIGGDKDSCYYVLGTLKHDPLLCEKIKTYQTGRDFCYLNAAEAKQNTSICGWVENPLVKEACYNGSKSCDNMGDQNWRDLCYYNIVAIRQNHSICEKIVSEYRKDSCYYRVAEVQRDPTLCGTIVNQEIKDRCYFVTNDSVSRYLNILDY